MIKVVLVPRYRKIQNVHFELLFKVLVISGGVVIDFGEIGILYKVGICIARLRVVRGCSGANFVLHLLYVLEVVVH